MTHGTTTRPHCPFLNRSDVRCGSHFSLTTLGSAFDHCFGGYSGCLTYHELLRERRERQQQQGHRPGAISYAAGPEQLVQVRLHGHTL